MHWPQAMPPTKASNLYSTFSLNSTRLPVTSDMTCQKLPFTAHGQHGRSEDQIQWSYPSHFFSFRAADIELFTDNPGHVEGAARKTEAVQSVTWREKTSPFICTCQCPGYYCWQFGEKIIRKLHLILTAQNVLENVVFLLLGNHNS